MVVTTIARIATNSTDWVLPATRSWASTNPATAVGTATMPVAAPTRVASCGSDPPRDRIAVSQPRIRSRNNRQASTSTPMVTANRPARARASIVCAVRSWWLNVLSSASNWLCTVTALPARVITESWYFAVPTAFSIGTTCAAVTRFGSGV